MGGFGSGGWNATGRVTTGQALPLDVNALNKIGALIPGTISKSTWSHGDEPSGDIHVHANEDGINLIYKKRPNGGDWQDVNEHVSIVWEPCRYGGQRPFFLCPQCGKRILKLFGLNRFFCRPCNSLTYSSQRERWSDRAMRKANKMRTKLGGSPGMANDIAPKPLHLHFKTYKRIINEIHEAETEAGEFTLALVKRLIKRTPSTGDFWT